MMCVSQMESLFLFKISNGLARSLPLSLSRLIIPFHLLSLNYIVLKFKKK